MKRRFQLLPLVFFTVLFFLLNWYVLSGLQTVVHFDYFQPMFWALISISVGALIYALTGMQTRGMGTFFKIATHAFLMLFVSEILFLLVLLSDDGYRLMAGTLNLISNHHFLAPARNFVWISIGIAIFFASILSIADKLDETSELA